MANREVAAGSIGTSGTVLAIDPGKNGGLAWVNGDNEVFCQRMPKGIRDILLLVKQIDPVLAVIENVGGYRPGNSGPAACTFSRHVGNLEAILVTLAIPTVWVVPRVWMMALGEVPSDKAERKRFIVDSMKSRFPGLRVQLTTGDALGILVWWGEKTGRAILF